MNFLDDISYKIKERGYEYYIDECIVESNQINVSEFVGIVQGSENYHVKINIHHPKLSTCDCPYAENHDYCKHMVALYYYNFPDEAEQYFCENEVGEFEDEWDFDYKYREIPKKFDKPIYYDDLLTQYIDTLNINELKVILLKELMRDDYYTYNNYLKEYEETYKLKSKNEIFFINELKYKLKSRLEIRYHDFHNYKEPLLSVYEKTKIETIYKEYAKELDELLLNANLSVYDDYQWIVKFYKSKLSKDKLNIFKMRLLNLFDNYKCRGIKNTRCKSNILIAIDILSEFDLKELALSMIRNSKYVEYVDYIFMTKRINKELFNKINELTNSNLSKYKHYSVELYKRFVDYYPNDQKIKNEYVYISFMSKGNPIILSSIVNKDDFNEIINRILVNNKQDYNLIKLYIYLERFDDLYNMLMNKDDAFSLCNYILYFKDKYSDELEIYFKEKFYNKLKTGMKRDIYKESCKYINAIYKLENGKDKVEKIIFDLVNSEYKNRRALFEEISYAIK